MTKEPNSIYGVMAEFATHEQLLEATKRAYEEGFRRMDAFTPFPVEGLAKALGSRRTWVPPIMLAGGLTGAIGGYALQYWTSAVDYPLNIGGRPYHSWPMFVVITFELMVLCTAIFGVIGTFALNRLPRPYHPVFNLPEFDRASNDRFFLCIEVSDPKFETASTRQFLSSLGAISVEEVSE